jgi:general secretion pathway protein J
MRNSISINKIMECWRNKVIKKWRNTSRLFHYSGAPVYQRSDGNSGFTLLEILISIVIFATLLTTIYASYTGTFRVINDTESHAEIYRTARIAMERMIEDLESVYVQKGSSYARSEGDGGSIFQFLGEEREIIGRRADTLRFISSAHIDFSGQNPGYGAARIGYYVKESEDGEGFVLYRSDSPLFKETDYSYEESGGLVLCEGLISLAFTYCGQDGRTSESWDSASEGLEHKIPKEVLITLEFESTINPEVHIRFMTSVALPMEQTYL